MRSRTGQVQSHTQSGTESSTQSDTESSTTSGSYGVIHPVSYGVIHPVRYGVIHPVSYGVILQVMQLRSHRPSQLFAFNNCLVRELRRHIAGRSNRASNRARQGKRARGRLKHKTSRRPARFRRVKEVHPED